MSKVTINFSVAQKVKVYAEVVHFSFLFAEAEHLGSENVEIVYSFIEIGKKLCR